MEEIDVQKLPRKELLQLCSENNIRTAGVKHYDLVRLLQKKLNPPAADPSSSPRGKEKCTGETMPTAGLTIQRRGLRPLDLVNDPSQKISTEPSPRKNPAVLPRKLIATTPHSPRPQRSDFLRKKANALTAVGKLQAQERSRLAQQTDRSSVRGPNIVADAASIGKQVQDRLFQRSDGACTRSHSSSATIGAPKKFTRSASMEPAKRPGTRERAKGNDVSRFKAQTSPKLNAAYLEAAAKRSHRRASVGAASASATANSCSDFGSQNFDSVSEIGTDAEHHAMSEGSDADDGRSVTSVASEPISRFASQFLSPRAIAGGKLGRGESPLRNSVSGRRSSFDSSNAPECKHSDPSTVKNLISPLFLEDETSFNFVGDAQEQEMNSFLSADIFDLEKIDAAEGSHQVPDFEQARNAEIFTTGCQEEDFKIKQDAGNSMEGHEHTASHSESTPTDNALMEIHSTTRAEEISAGIQLPGAEIPHSIEISHLEESPATCGDQHERKRTEASVTETSQSTAEKDRLLSKNNSNAFGAEGQVTNTEKDDGDKLMDSTHNEESPNNGAISPTTEVELVTDQLSLLHRESPDSATVPYDFPRSGFTPTNESREICHVIFDSAPLPHPDMERSAITAMSGKLSQSSPTMNDIDAGGVENRVTTLRSLCDEHQQDFEIKLRRDYSKDESGKRIIADDSSVGVPLLQHPKEIGRTHCVRRSFPMSILHWCSQIFSAIFGTRNQR